MNMKFLSVATLLAGVSFPAVATDAQEKPMPSRATTATPPTPPNAKKRPNIVIMLADDMGFSDAGCYGSEIETPNIDRLATQGIRFSQFYVNPRCCPTRASLLTGLYPHQAGVGSMEPHLNRGMPPAYQGFLNRNCVTLAEVLRGANYKTYMTGKWHVGAEPSQWPVARGFDRYYGLIGGASNYFKLGPRQLAQDDRQVVAGENFYTTDAFTEHALQFLDGHKNEPNPFFLYVAFTAPHWPLHAPKADIAKYVGRYKQGWDAARDARYRRMVQSGLQQSRWPLAPRNEQVPAWSEVEKVETWQRLAQQFPRAYGGEDSGQLADRDLWDLKMAVYAAQIDHMDQNIGRLLAKLDAMGASDNTLVFFLSDNGPSAEWIDRGRPGVPPGEADSFLSYARPWANLSATPFREFKHFTQEAGVGVPMVARWPGVIAPGSHNDTPGHAIDFMPTFVEIAGATYPKRFAEHDILPLEGQSLLPALRGAPLPRRAPIFWEHDGNRAVRDGRWKLISSERWQPEWKLFDLEADRTELHDLSSQQPQRVQAMAQQYEQWAKRVGVVPWLEAQARRKKGDREAAQSKAAQSEAAQRQQEK